MERTRSLLLFAATRSFPADATTSWLDVSLAKARARHQKAREELAEGLDPAAEKQAAGKTFETVAREWHAHSKTRRNERYAYYVLERLQANIFPAIGSLPVCDIPTSAFRNAVQKIQERGALDIAKRVLRNCGQVLRYAVANEPRSSHSLRLKILRIINPSLE